MPKREFVFKGEITKRDDEQQMVWGWAYVTDMNGQTVVDYSGESADWEEVQKAAHGFMLESREGDVMHVSPVAGHIVDSLFFSPEIQKALGIDLGKIGWFIGYHVEDPEIWQDVKAGKFQAFSIAGTAIKEPA